jgi:hypothetical protein
MQIAGVVFAWILTERPNRRLIAGIELDRVALRPLWLDPESWDICLLLELVRQTKDTDLGRRSPS